MKGFRKIGFGVRLIILLGALGAVFQLYVWSRRADPRFYLFLATSPGRRLALVFHWQGVTLLQPEDKPDSQLTDSERRLRQSLAEEVRAAAPTAQLEMNDGRILLGRVRAEDEKAVEFEESYGSSGALALRVRRSRIREIRAISEPPPHITYRDVRFKQEFPALHFFKRAPYSVLTDEKYFQVEGAVRELQKLNREFVSVFGPVMTREPAGRNIQVVFCSQEEVFRKYQRRYAPRLESSVGFYSPATDRFLVFNQKNSEQMRLSQTELDEQAGRLKANERIYGGARRIEGWKKDAGLRLASVAEEQTRETIRHEGAHQLFFDYGVHSSCRMENEWLYEGLAVYCETPRLGDKSSLRIDRLKEAAAGGALIPLPELVARRSAQGLFSFGPPEQVELAYGESWALVHFLMQPDRRPAWFDYLRYLRDESHFREVLRTPAYELLCRCLGTAPDEFQRQWLQYVKQM